MTEHQAIAFESNLKHENAPCGIRPNLLLHWHRPGEKEDFQSTETKQTGKSELLNMVYSVSEGNPFFNTYRNLSLQNSTEKCQYN